MGRESGGGRSPGLWKGVSVTFFAAIALGIAVYTGSFALETWKSGNRFGGAVLFLLAALTFALPAVVFTQ